MSRSWPGPSRQLLRRLRKPSSFLPKRWRDSLETDRTTKAFFNRVRELNLEPKLILFPRNQPQWINSSYADTVKSFRRSDSFEPVRCSGSLNLQTPGSRVGSSWQRLTAPN